MLLNNDLEEAMIYSVPHLQSGIDHFRVLHQNSVTFLAVGVGFYDYKNGSCSR